ncbi:hypothetical protein F4781DRAFT_387128 [Annulohypoxylon bovei var. microspora]|nr:hypothetical protein F4781DRAFT_387128 [Annulohypoxylon bovei var. microspora]
MMTSTNDNGVWKPGAPFNKNEIQWPQSYYLRPLPAGAPRHRWWNCSYYRGSQNQHVQISYSSDATTSELIAQEFLNEPVLGFDMEWPWDPIRQAEGKIALIQIACENKIALFHIALYGSKTTEELIVPSLRRIIESAHILKTGVAIMNADFRKLKAEFPLQPRGAFELSHLYNLITFGSRDPKQVTTRLRKLSLMVETHLGFPLDKGPVRKSNWSLPLDDKQKAYAANDAYAGFMLFHCMNAKRLKMSPKPPLPKLAEFYQPFANSPIILVQLEPETDEAKAKVFTAVDFFVRPQPRSQAQNSYAQAIIRHRQLAEKRAKESSEKTKLPLEPATSNRDIANQGSGNRKSLGCASSDELYRQLYEHRKTHAALKGCLPYTVAANLVLEALARDRPTNSQELLCIEGIGKDEVTSYGPAWLRIIAGFKAEHESKPSQSSISNMPTSLHPEGFFKLPQPHPSDQPPKRKRTIDAVNSKKPLSPQPVASTGLSFQFTETRLNDDEAPAKGDDGVCHDGSDEPKSGSLNASPSSSLLKRKRAECSNSPCKKTNTASLTPNASEVSAPPPVNEAPQPEPLSPKHKLLRKKLDAYVKSVVWAMDPKPTQPIVSGDTLQCLVTTLPRNLDEFHKVPDIQAFIQACEGVQKDLWLTFSTWTRDSGLVPSS